MSNNPRVYDTTENRLHVIRMIIITVSNTFATDT